MMRVLLIEDDEAFRSTLAFALKRRGVSVYEASDGRDALEIKLQSLGGIILDMRLGPDSGADLIEDLRLRWPEARIVILTGYGSIPEALHTARLGADDYLLKSAGADQILDALTGQTSASQRSNSTPLPSLARLEWEHIQRVLHDCDGNISHTADILGIDRRTLQRKLAKLPPEA
jgi:two-component system, response regulator RegA